MDTSARWFPHRVPRTGWDREIDRDRGGAGTDCAGVFADSIQDLRRRPVCGATQSKSACASAALVCGIAAEGDVVAELLLTGLLCRRASDQGARGPCDQSSLSAGCAG